MSLIQMCIERNKQKYGHRLHHFPIGSAHDDDGDINVADFSGNGNDNMDKDVNEHIVFPKTKLRIKSQ